VAIRVVKRTYSDTLVVPASESAFFLLGTLYSRGTGGLIY
jgi:hypothetical protein